MVRCENLQKLFKELSLEGGAMYYILLNSIMQSSKRAKRRLLDSLQPPSATEVRHAKKDRSGFIVSLVIMTLLITFVLVI